MDTNPAAPASAPAPTPAPSAPPPAAGNSLRLVILLGVLVLVIGTFAYDQFVIKPDCDKAFDKIQKLVDERNKLGVKSSSLVTSKDIQKELGWGPTWTEDNPQKGYTIEHYCWWGKTPLLTRRRHFIAVLYVGAEPRHFSAHFQEDVPDEALPIEPQPAKDDGTTVPFPKTVVGGSSEPPPADQGESGQTDAKPAGKNEENKSPEAKSGETNSPETKSGEAAQDKS